MPHKFIAPVTGACAALMLSACADGLPPLSNPPSFAEAEIERDSQGACYGRDVTPALFETVTEQVLVQPAQIRSDGSVQSPAIFRTVTRQHIIRERREVLFETVCPSDETPQFVASVQRALTARGFYAGTITGVMDSRTRRAIRDFQRQSGLDSDLLDIRTARVLGLVALTPEQLGIVEAAIDGK